MFFISSQGSFSNLRFYGTQERQGSGKRYQPNVWNTSNVGTLRTNATSHTQDILDFKATLASKDSMATLAIFMPRCTTSTFCTTTWGLHGYRSFALTNLKHHQPPSSRCVQVIKNPTKLHPLPPQCNWTHPLRLRKEAHV
ncbi:Hypothetical predicted protein [Marmota monax]|uniref:Uncharacterized protein n=1 Tax=Marmota monax TaxID=9995 RepID=A0A5E4B0C8_MARMO|nr:hypothetical protein GHT09_008862 [Marmota monax]VTJ63114.1 Hypothetical predicted protein [Marmota monax]